MAAPVYVSNGLITGGSNVTSVAIAYPASPLANDVALLLVHGDFSGTINTPAGWTQIGVQTASLSVDACVYWKRLVGGETGTVTVTRSGTAANAWFGGTMSMYRNCLASGTPYEYFGSNTGSTASQAGVATTTTGPDRLAVHLWSFGDNLTSAPAAGWTEDWEQLSALGNAGAQFADSRTAATAGTITAPTRTISVGNPWVVFGLALFPDVSMPLPVSPAIMHMLVR